MLYPTCIYSLETPNEPKDKIFSLPDSWSWCYVSFYKFCLASWSANSINSISIATIICILYIGALSNRRDFFYASTDVAIWSLSETGLAIIASACAILRPLLTRSGFLGSLQTVLCAAYPNRYSNFKNQRYKELVQRSDSAKQMGITTMIGKQSESIEEPGSPLLLATGIRKTVVISMYADTRGL